MPFRADWAECKKPPGLYLVLQRYLPIRCIVSLQEA